MQYKHLRLSNLNITLEGFMLNVGELVDLYFRGMDNIVRWGQGGGTREKVRNVGSNTLYLVFCYVLQN